MNPYPSSKPTSAARLTSFVAKLCSHVRPTADVKKALRFSVLAKSGGSAK